ncbi:hypothetical protein BCR32DRAFT_296996 [Anaeromyces robustus]|jgi:hypothetical protein|uniref:Uncharacterized protein n=1 Tax=Anaeromyces robustus TaxID=1754192 RepID=A0A1Y1WPR7_9FUNG|nr:hypothetical protein BCR32DRAFT_296996 [Anaeromyces robustus]|eukprot:ORX75288.1 hypothetical protein BCR32DRAFT_296996 [Anaeromyces robustus]
MNSFKLFNRTNKNVIASNKLNGIEIKENGHKNLQPLNDKKNTKNNTSTPSHQQNITITITNANGNIDNKTPNNSEDNKLNENDDENNKESVINKKNSKQVKESSMDDQNELISKKEKNKKLKKEKKEKRKNKKNKKKKSNNENIEFSSSPKSPFSEGFLLHSTNLSKKNSITGKYTGKQPVRKLKETPKEIDQSEVLVKSYNENTQFQKENQIEIKEKQSRMGYTSDSTPTIVLEKEKHNKNYSTVFWTRPERKESRMISDKFSSLNRENNGIKNEENHENNINITTPTTSTFTSPKDNIFKFNFDNDSILNLPICLGMTTPSSPAFSSITPINAGESCNNSIGIGDLVYTGEISNGEEDLYSFDNSYRLETMFKELSDNEKEKGKGKEKEKEEDKPKSKSKSKSKMENEKENEKENDRINNSNKNIENNAKIEKIDNITEKRTSHLKYLLSEEDQFIQEVATEIKERQIPWEYNANDLIEGKVVPKEYLYKKNNKEKDKSKFSKKKDKKPNGQLSINTKITQSVTSSALSPSTKSNPNSAVSETKKKWNTFKKLFGKKNNNNNSSHNNKKSSMYYRNTTIVDDSLRHHSTNSSGIYDWNELRRRMELEENSTICSENLNAREFAEAIGIPIISSSDEEDDLRFNAENNGSLSANHSLCNNFTSYSSFGHTHHSMKSSGPRLDMSIFIPPDKNEKKNSPSKNNLLNPDMASASINTAYSFASSTTQDYLDKLGNDLKRKVYNDSQSVNNTYEQINIHSKIYDNDSLVVSLNNDRVLESPLENIYNDTSYTHSVPYHKSTNNSLICEHNHDHLNSKPSWSSTNGKGKISMTSMFHNIDNEEEVNDDEVSNISNIEEREISFNNENISIRQSQKEVNENLIQNSQFNNKNRHKYHQSYNKSLGSLEMEKKSYTDLTDGNSNSCSKNNQLEDNFSKVLSKDSLKKPDNNNLKMKSSTNMGKRSPSISSVRSTKTYSSVIKSYKGEDSLVQEYQKGRFTVTKPIYPSNNGHRVFIVTRDEENENGDSITTVSSISSSPGKLALRKRAISQPASFFYKDSDTRSYSSQKIVGSTSLSKYRKSYSDINNNNHNNNNNNSNNNNNNNNSNNNNDIYSTKIYFHHASTPNILEYKKKRKSTVSLDTGLLNNSYNNIYGKFDNDNQEDPISEEYAFPKKETKSEKEKTTSSLHSVDTNKSYSSLYNKASPSPTNSPTASPYTHLYKPKNSNSRFQVTYTPGSSLSPSNKSIRSFQSIESPNINKLNIRLFNDETSSVDTTHMNNTSETISESNGITNHMLINYNNSNNNNSNNNSNNSNNDNNNNNTNTNNSNNSNNSNDNNTNNEDKTGRTPIVNALGLSNMSTGSSGVGPRYLQQSFSISNGNNSLPALSNTKVNSYHGNTKSLSIITSSSNHSVIDSNNNNNNEKITILDSTCYSSPTSRKIHDTTNDYYNFLKYNDSYNSIFLNSSKDNEKSEKENDTILDEMDKTEDSEILKGLDKTNDLSDPSSPSPYYNHLATPMEKPPMIPNSPISYKSISSLNNAIEENNSLASKLPMKGNNNSNESFTIFDKELVVPDDESFHEPNTTTLTRKDSKTSTSNTSMTTPTIKTSILINKRSNVGHYRSPSTSSTTSSRFTVIREGNEIHSPKVTKRISNLHNFTSISYDQEPSSNNAISEEASSSVPTSKLKPSVVVIKKVEEKPDGSGGVVTTTTQSTNIGRFTVTRETIIS